MDGKKRICVIGAGAAGMAAAWSLSRFPDRFYVEVWEKSESAGGVATSVTIENHSKDEIGDVRDEGDCPSLYINDGVQGGSFSYRNTLLLHKLVGMEPSPVHMKVSFGQGATAWNNYGKDQETPLVKKLAPEIRRFGGVLKLINRLEPIFIFIPIATVLRCCRFSSEFANLMVFPLTALFFGTGNQTPNVSAAIIARVFLDPDLRLFDYDPHLLLSQTPEMFAFKKLGDIYDKLVKLVEKDGHSKVRLNHPAVKVKRSDEGVVVTDNEGNDHAFDEAVFACDAETVLKILDEPHKLERIVLGNVRYYNDITVTHEDLAYMQKYYEIDMSRNDQYFVRVDPDDNSKIDMSFDMSNYQPQLKGRGDRPHIFQTIFLDDTHAGSWTIDEISKDKVILRKWWRQFAHTWRHFAFTVPFVKLLQGHMHTWFCGSYTLFNTHEIATISGLAVAHRLGAPYPFSEDQLAKQQFDMYLKYIHGISTERGLGSLVTVLIFVAVILLVLYLWFM